MDSVTNEQQSVNTDPTGHEYSPGPVKSLPAKNVNYKDSKLFLGLMAFPGPTVHIHNEVQKRGLSPLLCKRYFPASVGTSDHGTTFRTLCK